MDRALALARRGMGRVEPNPMVGCVLVRGGRIVGEGYHRRFGGPHAEVEALRGAGARAHGATAFVTLEPCCHHGKTPPCTDALIAAGVSRVVAAMPDPFPRVAGAGLRQLRAAGIRVDVGLRQAEAAELVAPFVTRLTRSRPYVILKWAQSIDGRIATRTGDSKWISGERSRRMVHRLRARVDGILVGVGTVLADDPQLTARNVRVLRRAARLVADSRLRIPLKCRLVASASSAQVTVYTTHTGLKAAPRKADHLRAAGVHVVAVAERRGRVDLARVLRGLAESGCTNLLVEGGGELIASIVEQRLADEALIFQSPRIIGGRGAVPAVGGQGPARIQVSPPIRRFSHSRIGDDLLFRIRFDS